MQRFQETDMWSQAEVLKFLNGRFSLEVNCNQNYRQSLAFP